MIRVSQLKMPLSHTGEEVFEKLRKKLRVEKGEILKYTIRKRSLDARKAEEIHYTYAIDVTLQNEEVYLKKNRDRDITRSTTVEYLVPKPMGEPIKARPVVCGSGPAGLFCAYFLAQAGYRPVIIERGEEVGRRSVTVERFFAGEPLNTESNVQFGEGGAGTFSDGKLNTMVKDTYGRIRKVLEIFVQAGAPEEILYQNKPHIGTDKLRTVVAAMRRQIEEWGGEFYFNTKLTKIHCHGGQLVGISCVDTGIGKKA
ncbi:MAG: NAD(P)-binding protein, partial [Lachnospiraceae bacterium]|nr:NAD(P)-binding protein [Lachnospiraceae bacterium]